MSRNGKPWTFVTSHTQVLLCLARDPDVRLLDVAQTVGITERAAQRIVTDLVEAGYVQRTRIGRRNRYAINPTIEMRHQSQHGHEIGTLLDLLRLDTAPGHAEPPQAGHRSSTSRRRKKTDETDDTA
jgi:DNA-binding MarR family transcriptional regulator